MDNCPNVANPDQADRDEDGIGNICESWDLPDSIFDNISPDGQDATHPQVAIDNDGNAIIVWNQSDWNNFQIFKSEYRDETWLHPSDLSDYISFTGQDAGGPQIAMDNNGNVIIVWWQSDGYNWQIFKSEYRNGVWIHPTDLNDNISPDGQDAFNPQISIDANGNAIVVWEQFDGNTFQIFKSEYNDGIWTHPSDLNDSVSCFATNATNPQVAMDDNGNSIIAWVQKAGGKDQIFMSEYRNGTWSSPQDYISLETYDGLGATNPQVAMDNNENAIIIWAQSDGVRYQLYKSEYRDGIWTHPSDLNDHISLCCYDIYSPKIAMNNDGNAIIVWYQLGGFPYKNQIFKSEYRDGIWNHPTDLNNDNISPNGQDAVRPQVTMDNNGDAIIVWEQSDGNNFQIFKSEYYDGNWTHPSDLNDNISPDGQWAGYAKVATDNNGNAVIVWVQSDSINDQIFLSEYRW